MAVAARNDRSAHRHIVATRTSLAFYGFVVVLVDVVVAVLVGVTVVDVEVLVAVVVAAVSVAVDVAVEAEWFSIPWIL